jgi:hypothetical protein
MNPVPPIGCPHCGTTVKSTWLKCPLCGTYVQGIWWKSVPGNIERRGTLQAILMFLAGMACFLTALIILGSDRGWPQPMAWQTYVLGIILFVVGFAFIVGMYVIFWWYADKGPHEVIPFKPPGRDPP